MGWKDSPISFTKVIEGELKDLHVKIVSYLIDQVVDRSPVDTSAFISNNIVSASPDYSFDDSRRDLYGVTTKQKAKAMVESLKNVRFIYIQNNAPYAELLEHGSSKQAPTGIYNMAYLSANARFK